MFRVSVSRIFKNAGRAFVIESFFSIKKFIHSTALSKTLSLALAYFEKYLSYSHSLQVATLLKNKLQTIFLEIHFENFRNFAKFTGKHLRQSLFFSKVAD